MLKEIEEVTQVATLKAIIFDTLESNLAKIKLIQEEIASGRYQINSHHIAEKLLEHAFSREPLELA
jgi:anti-sigma28 factor (negative regulator of flagellin synthesis)